MQPILRVLIILQTIAVEIAALGAMGEIRTAVLSGPILGGTGLIIVYLAFRRNLPWGLCFGLATPTAYVLGFSLICGFGWEPYEAQMYMFLILVAVALLHVAAAFVALAEVSTAQGGKRQKLPFQFSIMALLVLMFLVSVFFGSYQTFGPVGASLGALFVYGVIVTYVIRQFLVMQLRQREENVKTTSFPVRDIDGG